MTDLSSDTSPQVDALEAEKWQFERECRLREVAVKEREQANRDSEVRLKEREIRASTWKSPLTVAVFAAAVAGAGNAIVAIVNGSLQRELESSKRVAELTLERSKAESTRILEMIKTGDNDRAASNLDFLIQSGLITDDLITKKLTAFLKTRQPGTGPSLPASDPRFALDQSSRIDQASQTSLQERLNKYLSFLDQIGFPPSMTKVLIHIESKQIGNAYYDGSRIVIDKRLVEDPSVALREYTHHVLSIGNEKKPWQGQYAAVESGLADYFACSFLGDPKVGTLVAKVLKTGKSQLRLLENTRTFDEFRTLREFEVNYEGAEIWGGLFWKLRLELELHAADRLLAAAWQATAMQKSSFSAELFIASMLRESAKLGESERLTVRTALSDRRFPLPK